MAVGGLAVYGRGLALAGALPAGTNRYVALLTAVPTVDAGTGLVEATGSGYARKAHSAWTNGSVGDVVTRANNGSVEFTALTDALTGVVGWAIYDAATVGNLVAWGYTRNVGGVKTTFDFALGDQPRFIDGELVTGVGPEDEEA